MILLGIIRIFREMRQGKYYEATLEEKLNQRGLMEPNPWTVSPQDQVELADRTRLGFCSVSASDTATEVGLLALAAGAAAGGLPWYAHALLANIVRCLDAAYGYYGDGVFMNVAYGSGVPAAHSQGLEHPDHIMGAFGRGRTRSLASSNDFYRV